MRRLSPHIVPRKATRWMLLVRFMGLFAFSSCASDSNFDIGDSETETETETKSDVADEDSQTNAPKQSATTGPNETQKQPEDSTTQPAPPPSKQELRVTLDKRLDSYCQAGSVSCFLMNKMDEGLLSDVNNTKLQIHPQKSEIVSPDLSSYLFESALQVVPGTRPQSLETFTLPERGIIGFDVWIRPNSADTNPRWNAIALDGFLSLQTVDPNILACKYNVGLSPTFPWIPKPELLKVPVSFPKDKFVHVACAYDGSNVSLWVNGTEHKGPRHSRVILPTSSRYLLNWSSVAQTPFDGQLGPLRFWHDIETMRQELRNFHQILSAIDP